MLTVLCFTVVCCTNADLALVEAKLGPNSFAFTASNPTGHHSLNLSKKQEREVSYLGNFSECASFHIVAQLLSSEMKASFKGGPELFFLFCLHLN